NYLCAFGRYAALKAKVRRLFHVQQSIFGAADFRRGGFERGAASRPEREPDRRRQKGRQGRRLWFVGVGHRGLGLRRVQEKNRHRGRILARAGDQGDGPGVERASRGKTLVDVILTNDNPMQIMVKEGLFAKYDSPAAKEFTKDAIDPNLGPRYRNVVIGVVYNRDVIKPADAPKSLEDLVKPQYRGKLVMPDPTQHTTTTQWVASLDKLMGKEK